MYEFCLETTHEFLGCPVDNEESLLWGVFAIRKADDLLVMLRILDFRQLPQTRRTVMAARVKANLRYPSHHIAQIYSMEESSDKSKVLIELYLSTDRKFESLLFEGTISIERAFKLISELIYGTVELIEYYMQRNIALTSDILCNTILLPDTLFILHDDTIVLPNPCITTIDAELGLSNRILRRKNWARYASPEICPLMSDNNTEITINTLEKALIWSIGMLASDLYSLIDTSNIMAYNNLINSSINCDDNNVPIVPVDDIPYAIRELISACLMENVASRIDCRTLTMSLEAIQNMFLSSSVIHNPIELEANINTSLTSDEESFLILSKEQLCVERPRHDPVPTDVYSTYDIHDVLNACDYSLSSDYFHLEDNTRVRRHSICCFETTCASIHNCHARSRSECWSKTLTSDAFQRYIEAATEGNSSIVAIYINKYARSQSDNGTTALIAAVKGGRHDCVSLLAQYEAGLQDSNGLSALMYAVIQHDIKSIQLLYRLECRLTDRQGMTALMYAAEHDYYDLLHLLMEEIDMVNANGMNAYDIAEKLGHSRSALILEPYSLQIRALHVVRINNHGYTALMFATIQNDVVTVQQLASLEGGAVAEDGSTALHAAILHNHYLCVPPLLRYERFILTKDGITPLKLAEKLNRYECIRILRGPVVKGYLPIGLESSLMKEARNGDPELLNIHLGDALLMSAKGETALMIAAAAGNYRCVKKLLHHEQGIVSPDGWTALMYASLNGHTDCVGLLCTNEAMFTNTTGQLAYDIAIERGHKACAQLLSKYEKYLTVAYRVDELLALDLIDDAVKLLKQPFVPSEALVKCIWSMQGGEFLKIWGTFRANTDLNMLARYITLDMSVDLNDPELTDLVLKRKIKFQLSNTEQIDLENLLHKAFISRKFLVIPLICEYAMNMHINILVHKQVGKAVTQKTKLMLAAESGDLSEVEQNLRYLCFQYKGMCTFQREKECSMLDNRNKTVNKTVNSVTALMLAAVNGHRNCIHALLPEMGLRDQASGTTALILAIWCGKTAIVRQLLPEAGIADNSGVTPFMHASKRNSKKCAQLIETYLKKRR